MILALFTMIGLLAALCRTWVKKQPLTTPCLNKSWLVPVAFLPQLLAFYLPTSQLLPDEIAAVILVGSQLLLLSFVWLNRHQAGFWLIGAGLALNLVVISLNGGLMPINLETVTLLFPERAPDFWQVGGRLGNGKDIVRHMADIRLSFLSDYFLFAPSWSSYRVAFSLGDIFLAIGTAWTMWSVSVAKQPIDQPKLAIRIP